MHCCPGRRTNPMRLSRCGKARGCPAPMHSGPPTGRSTPTPTIRRAQRGRRDRTGPRTIPIAEREIIFGWLIPIGERRTRDDAFPERSRLASLVLGCWPLHGGCGAHYGEVSRATVSRTCSHDAARSMSRATPLPGRSAMRGARAASRQLLRQRRARPRTPPVSPDRAARDRRAASTRTAPPRD